MTSRIVYVIVQSFLTTLMTTGLWAQGTVTIYGTATDPSDAVVPNVNVTVTNTQTQAVRNTVTGASGNYVVVQLPVGVYSVTARASGFKEFNQKDIRVQVDENRRVDLRMEVGELTEQISVEAPLTQVETRTGTLREVVDARRIVDLPLNGRNALQLRLLVPGFSAQRNAAQEQNAQIGINGSTFRSNNYTLDGGDNHDPFFNTASVFPNPDALQEFSINTSSYGADQGRNSGVVVNAITKSGTNEIHGALFEFLRNEDLNARSFFANTIPPFKRNQFGGTVGGPILKDQTFFFVSYQATRERSSPQVLTATMLTDGQRQGDFSDISKELADPDGGLFENNMIPRSRQSEPALNFLDAFVPLPNRPQGLYSFPDPANIDDNQFILKVDHQLTNANRAHGRLLYNFNDSTLGAPSTVPGFLTALEYTTWNFTLSDTHVFSPTLLNTVTFTRQNTLREQLPIVPGNLSWEDLGSGLRVAHTDDTPAGHGVNVRGYFFAFNRIPLDQLRISYQFSDQVSLTRGPHQIRFGADVRRSTTDRLEYPGNPGPGFRDRFTGDAAADFLMGRISEVGQGSRNTWLQQGNEYSAYIQDNWKVSPRLTLNLGVRWDPFTPTPDREGLASTFWPGRQSSVFPLAPPGLVFEEDDFVPRSTIKNRWNNWGPRFGFALDPSGDGKTSVRGGYGIFHGQLFGQGYGSAGGPAKSLRINIDAPPGGLDDPYSTLPGGFPFPYSPPTEAERATFDFPTPLAISGYDLDYRNSITQQWNFNIQRQLFESYILTVSYVGSKGNHLLMGRFADGVGGGIVDANPGIPGPGPLQPRRIYHPYFARIEALSSRGNSLFHSFQLNLNKRFSQGFSILTSYTFANLLSDTAGDDFFDFSQERGRGGVKHRYVGSFIWELPKLTNRHPAVRHIFGGWETNGIITLQSGGYLTVGSGRDNNQNGVNKDRPDLVGNPFLDTGRARSELMQRYFNPDAFVQNQPGTLGDVGRGILEGPGLAMVDFGLFKNIHITERYRIQYRAEFFNLLNRPNLGNPNTNIASGNVGRITSTGDPRVVQMALKFFF